ncbi:MAG: FtsX-like permease family protein [Chlorobi bacterium]|nr:FtsX-like permease family protein [Chlorobiota bacterium]
MFKNYLLTAVRFLKRNKLFTLINLGGLSIALACSFFILVYVLNEISYDKSHLKRDRIYRVISHSKSFESTSPGTPFLFAPTLKKDFPEVETACRARILSGLELEQTGEFVYERRPVSADPEIFDIFTIPLVSGNPEQNLLENENDIIISEKIAKKYYKGENPIGKILNAKLKGKPYQFRVTAVMENFPANSSFHTDILTSIELSYNQVKSHFSEDPDYVISGFFWSTYILLPENYDPSQFEDKLQVLNKQYAENEQPDYEFTLQSLSDTYLHSDHIVNNPLPIGNLGNIYLFAGIGLLIVLIACANYIILGSALSMKRAKEIGLRKVMGANKGSIRKQILIESSLLALMSIPIALVLIEFFMPFIEQLFNTKIIYLSSNIVFYILGFLSIILITGMLSGLYIAFYLSSLKTIDILKNKPISGKNRVFVRKALISFQLVIFMILIFGLLTVRNQFQFVLNQNLGFDKGNLYIIKFNNDKFNAYDEYLEKIKSSPYVINAGAAMMGPPTYGSMSMMVPTVDDPETKIQLEGMAVGFNFLETFGFKILEGRAFGKEYSTDYDTWILNETAVKQLGLTNPVGKTIEGSKIIGVVKDFHFHSFHTEIPPLNIELIDEYIQQIAVRIQADKIDETKEFLEREWEKLAPDLDFHIYGFDGLLKGMYDDDERMMKLLLWSSVISILIAVSGLIGTTLFILKSRTSEIGVRKVFGSSVSSIVFSIQREFGLLVIISFVIAIPVGIYFMNRWLENYVYRAGYNWQIFVLTGLTAIVIVATAVTIQAIKASNANPVDSLKYE